MFCLLPSLCWTEVACWCCIYNSSLNYLYKLHLTGKLSIIRHTLTHDSHLNWVVVAPTFRPWQAPWTISTAENATHCSRMASRSRHSLTATHPPREALWDRNPGSWRPSQTGSLSARGSPVAASGSPRHSSPRPLSLRHHGLQKLSACCNLWATAG